MNPHDSHLNTAGEPQHPVGSNLPGTGRPRELTSDELLCGHPEVCIRHGTEVYRLRATKNGKLILTK